MSAERLSEAAALLRERAESVNWSGKRENYAPGVRNGLGGTAGELAALMAPPVALALADWLDAEGALLDGQEKYPDLHTTPNFGRVALMQAVTNAILGDQA